MKSVFIHLALVCSAVSAADQIYQKDPASASEPLAKTFSPCAAAEALDTSMRMWQQENRCIQCHANMHYGLARPLLDTVLPEPAEYDALRQAGLPAGDARLRSAATWLKTNQRESGRWFVPSLNGRPNHVRSNSATAWAVIALAECGELVATNATPNRAGAK